MRALQLESLEMRQLMAANLANPAANIDYSQSRVIVRFEGKEQNSALVSSLLQNDVVLSQSGNVHRFDLRSGLEMQTVLNALRTSTGVVFAQPDYKLGVSMTPNDPYYAQQWDLHNTGANSGGAADADIDAPEAWDTQRGSSATIVAVIDTGIDYTHPDLAANIWTNPGEIAGNNKDDDGNGYVDDVRGYDFANNDSDPMDDNQHGTHVSGTIGAIGNNGKGIAGINWNVKLMALKFLDGDGSGYDSDAVRALDYAVKMGAKVSNNSWGGGGNNIALRDAIERARSSGHIFVAAAGNDGRDNDRTANYPSNYPSDNIIAVAATDATDNLASWSNWGATTVDLAAPGVKILSTLPGNRYGTLSGTSMATPHVVGVVALVMSQNPTYTYRQVIDKVLSSVDPLPQLAGRVVSGGRLNSAKTLAITQPPPPPAPGPYALGTGAYGSSAGVTSIVTTFDKEIDPASVSKADIVSFTSPTGANWMSKITGISVSGAKLTITFAPVNELGRSRITFGPDIRDKSGNQMNQDRDTTAGEAVDDRWVASFSVPGTFSFASTQQIPIPDKKTITSTINVTRDVRIADLDVKLNIRHTYDRDLIISLTSPQGRTITLINRQGGGNDNFTNTLLDDEAAKAISAGIAPFTGSFRPDTALSNFDTLGGQGIWTLTITDVVGLDSGTLLGWSLHFTSFDSLARPLSGAGNGGRATTINVVPTPNLPAGKNDATATVHTFAFRDDSVQLASTLLRKGLITGQFVTSIAMIVCTIVIGSQLDYLQNKDLGYQKEQVIIIPTSKPRLKGMELAELYRNELLKQPQVAGASVSLMSFAETPWINIGYSDDKNVYRSFQVNAVDPYFLKTMGIQIAEGRDFSANNPADQTSSMIVNEALVKHFGWKNGIGQKLPGKIEQQIVGVVKDFNYQSLHTKIEPLAMIIKPDTFFRRINDISFTSPLQPRISVRLKAGNLTANLNTLKQVWKSVAPEQEFEYRFLDETIAAQYRAEQRTGTIVKIASTLSIFIACMGLFGLATLTVVRRTREIGIRKVLGASVGSLVQLLSKEFLMLVIIAALIAFPLGWWAMNKWLEDFAYRIHIAWWVFPLAGIAALLIALLTVSIQAIKAALANPVKSLRTE